MNFNKRVLSCLVNCLFFGVLLLSSCDSSDDPTPAVEDDAPATKTHSLKPTIEAV